MIQICVISLRARHLAESVELSLGRHLVHCAGRGASQLSKADKDFKSDG